MAMMGVGLWVVGLDGGRMGGAGGWVGWWVLFVAAARSSRGQKCPILAFLDLFRISARGTPSGDPK